MRKNTLFTFLSISLFFSLVGCGGGNEESSDSSLEPVESSSSYTEAYINNAYINENKTLIVSGNLNIKGVSLYKGESLVKSFDFSSSPARSVNCDSFEIDYLADYKVSAEFINGDIKEKAVNIKALYRTEDFNELYAYEGELGAIYSKEKTTFRVWSPVSSSIILNIYNTGTPSVLGGNDDKIITQEMVKKDKGVFEAVLDGDLAGKYYTYSVTSSTYQNREVVDPYAYGAGINGIRGMIVDFSLTNPSDWEDIDYLPYDRKSLVVYETHVADVTSSSTWNGDPSKQKLFTGMYQEGTKYSENEVTVKTGFDHIKELGVNAVQILPFFDQANDETNMSFNWGYNPLNYNVVEGGYSSDPYDGYVRIRELKELIAAYNKAGIEIIMDVVYNHVNSAIGSSFDVLYPGYYYRYNLNNTLSDGSACGNETASDHYMFRKFMIDSTSFWMKEYKLGGFRFDLMGLHDVETMNQLSASCKEINPYAVIYGEPWTGSTSPLPENEKADKDNADRFIGFGLFNDKVRDALHGGVSGNLKQRGWVSLDKKKSALDITNALRGIGTGASSDPDKTLNYVTCHDNRTFVDRMVASTFFTMEKDYETLKELSSLAHSIIMLSQGTSFMLAGEEFLRTKFGDENSYQSSYKVNELDYSLKVKNYDLFERFQYLIDMKINNDVFHYNYEEATEKIGVNELVADRDGIITYLLKDDTYEYKIIFKNHYVSEQTFNIPARYDEVISLLGNNYIKEQDNNYIVRDTIILKEDLSK